EVDLLRLGDPVEELTELVVVVGPLGDRLLEDRRVRGHADDGVLAHHPRELAGVEQVPREVVDPDALPVLGELLQRCLVSHGSSPFTSHLFTRGTVPETPQTTPRP